MRILITGAGGFVGGHLARHILDTTPDAELHGTLLDESQRATAPDITGHLVDLRDLSAIRALLKELEPDHIYHLAAQAFVPRSFEAPWETLENNILGQLNIIQACLALNQRPRILVISSAEIYGIVRDDELPLDENTPLRPTSPYSVSKVAQDMLGLQYYLSHQFPIMRARPFNHFGPGQSEQFVAPAFAFQIARIEASQQESTIYVGDLTTQRDFTDVRDIVRAYHLIMTQGTPGAVYNIASGTAHSIQKLLDTLLGYTSASIRIMVDPSRLRPTQIPVLRGDATRLRQETGWQPHISFEQSLLDILNNCRQRIRQEGQIL